MRDVVHPIPNEKSLCRFALDTAGSDHVYGIPEHATSMALKTTTASADGNDDAPSSHFSEPYRLYTLDVFEYELDSPAALYGAIPVMLGHRKGVTAGVFWFNPTETFVDVEQGVVLACARVCACARGSACVCVCVCACACACASVVRIPQDGAPNNVSTVAGKTTRVTDDIRHEQAFR